MDTTKLSGSIHDASKCCIDGWGAFVVSFEPLGMASVHEEAFRSGDDDGRERAFQAACDWFKKQAQLRALEPALWLQLPNGGGVRVKLEAQ